MSRYAVYAALFSTLLILPAAAPAVAGFTDMVAQGSTSTAPYAFAGKAPTNATPQQKAYQAYSGQQNARKQANAARNKARREADVAEGQKQLEIQRAAQAPPPPVPVPRTPGSAAVLSGATAQPAAQAAAPAVESYAPRHPGYPYTSD